ncbi:hypothetical protein J6590_071344 [Homalodisca vitripennis]|nr:hypothetical protein J6590_071344 [Homalodisca vitripennis]
MPTEGRRRHVWTKVMDPPCVIDLFMKRGRPMRGQQSSPREGQALHAAPRRNSVPGLAQHRPGLMSCNDPVKYLMTES